MRSARAKAPTAWRPVRLMMQVDVAARTCAGDFEAMIGTVDADLLEPESLDEERLLLAHVADRQHRTKESVRAHVCADLLGRPRLPLVGRIFDDLEQQTHRMAE